MTVRVGDRNPSRIEFLYQADILHRNILDLTFRKFGIHSTHSPFRSKYLYLLNHASDEEIDNYINKYCHDLEYFSDELILVLNSANSIFPKTKIEYDTRTHYILDAFSYLSSIKTILNKVAAYFDVDINLFKNTIITLDKEMDLLKRLKLSDKKRFGQFL